MRERIKVPPAEEVVEYLFKSRSLGFLQRDYRLLMWINHVHTLMLMDQGIITQEAGKSLLRALAELEERGIEASSLDPNLEDLYLNFEHSLIQKVGVDVGGRIHTGRSRNDIYATIARIAAREALFTFSEDLFELREALLQLAGEHVDTVAPGYTHLQPAQPTTFGHYLVSVSLALERDGERLLEVYPRLNLCPLGACAFAGTGFAIDRHMTARLLAFDGIVESTLDAVASRDYVSELLAAIAVMGVTLSRLAQDLYLWCSDEWATVEVGDDVASTSSIMPQKKNPIILEHIKSKAGHLVGALVSSLAVQKNVNFMHCRDMSTEAVAPLWDALGQGEAMLKLARRTVLGLKMNKELMLERAAGDFCTATELADFLVREKGLPFRLAHGIVGNLVTRVLDQGLAWNSVDSGLIDQVAQEITGEPLSLTGDQIRHAIDPLLNIQGKGAAGSPSQAETRSLISWAREGLEHQRSRVRGWQTDQDRARQLLERELARVE